MLPAVVVLSLCASRVLAVPYDSYPTYPSSGSTTTASSNNDNDNSILGGIENGFQRVWEGLTCMGDCRKTWGWTGNHFGADPWGGVLKAGDPMPYVPNSSSQLGASGATTRSTTSTSVSSSAGGFGILDVTTSAHPATFSVFNVPTLTRSTSTSTSARPTSTPPPPPPTTESPSPTPEPQLQTTQQQQQDPAPTTTQAPAQNNNNNNNNNGGGNFSPAPSSDQAAYLAAHNSARSAHGASSVSWSNQLEGFAQEWANNCQFQHSGGKFGRVGENLAAGTGNYGIAEMVGDWMAEVTEYNPSNPVASHFTQVVWKGTSQIGCAKATCDGIFSGAGAATYYVCEYSDAGNVSGQFGANVQK